MRFIGGSDGIPKFSERISSDSLPADHMCVELQTEASGEFESIGFSAFAVCLDNDT